MSRFAALLISVLVLLLPAGPARADALPVSTVVGDLVLDRASCAHGVAVGSWVALTLGSQAVRNSTPNCGNGALTLLQPGTTGLSSGSFEPDLDPVFDSRGDSRAGLVAAPVLFDGHRLGLASSAQDVQDAPYGPATFPVPQAYIQGDLLVMDLRALHLTYNGYPGSTCRSAQGHGCWLVGSQAARGSFSSATRAFTLDWTAGQGFAGPSAAATFHLAGHLVGRTTPVTAGVVLSLGAHQAYRVTKGPSAPPLPSTPAAATPLRLDTSSATADVIPERHLVRPALVAASLVLLLLLALRSRRQISQPARGRKPV